MEPALIAIVSSFAGLLLGGLVGWALRGRSTAGGDGRLEEELRRQADALQAQLEQANAGRLAAEKATAAATAKVEAAVNQIEERDRVHREQFDAFKAQQEKALEQMREAFGSLSAEALSKFKPELVSMAAETLAKQSEAAKGDLLQRQEAIKSQIEPLKEALNQYQARLAQSESSQANALGQVIKQIETLGAASQNLSAETIQLRRILGSNQARGRWGEETLRRVVEVSGMSPHCDFSEQVGVDESRPDLVVKLPGNRVIIVDSKVPDFEFLNSIFEDESSRADTLKSYADKLRATAKALADRDYPSRFQNAFDYVVLFVPSESLWSAALEGDAELPVWAAQRHIVFATPSMLIPLLRAVSLTWQQHEQAANAREIVQVATDLYGRVITFLEHFDNIRAGLSKAQDSYNSAVGSFERKIRPQGEKLERLGVSLGPKALPDIATIPDILRSAPRAG